MICASCGERTEAAPCAACGGDPLLEGHYRLEAELGRGASGTTFRAIDLRSGIAVAVKEMPLGRASSEKARELVDREASVLAQLDHPGIPGFLESRIVGSGRNQAVMLVQELVVGEDLARELETRRYTVPEVLAVARELLGILAYLHGLSPPIVHRDLKPGNVMRRSDGSLVLLDFGAVRDSLRDLDGSGSTVAGTFGYMAPEQLVGDATPMSDLYALGALMVHLLSRVDPQRMLSVGGGLEWEGRVSAPEGVRELLSDLLLPDPDERRARLGDTGEVARRVAALLEAPERPERREPAKGPPAALRKPRAEPKARTGVAIAASVLLAIGGAAAMVTLDEEKIEASAPALPPPPPGIPAAAPPPPPPVTPVERETVGVGDLPPRGVAGAPVTVVAFSDYQCPFCARADRSWEQLLDEREGQLAVYWRDLPLDFHRHARDAAHAARCAADQGRHGPMHAALIEHQAKLSEETPYLLASELGLDLPAFTGCMQSGRHAAAIDRDLAEAERLGVRATPTFFVDGERVNGAQPVDSLRAAVDRALER